MEELGFFGYIVFFILGTIIGSFLNVVLYRFHTGKSLGGRSHCMTCGKHLHWYELLPIVSYLSQGGACRGCRAYIPPRYLVVELLTGLSFLALFHLFMSDVILLVIYLVLVVVFILIVFYDIRHTIIPDELTLGVLALALVLSLYEYTYAHDMSVFFGRVEAGLGASAFFFGLWYVSKGRWIGFGDVKLAFPLGLMAGIGGVFSMVVFSFWIGAVVSVALLSLAKLVKRGKIDLHFLRVPLTMKSEVPFAPYLILGFIAVHFLHVDIFDITYTLFF